MIRSILNDCEIQNVLAYQAASFSDTLTSAAIDMAGFEGAIVLFKLGTVTSTGHAKCYLQQSSDDGSTDGYSDILASSKTSVGDASTTKTIAIEIINPQKRYIKALIDRTTANVVIDSVIVLKFGAKNMPVTQGSTVDGSTQLVAPIEGTA